MAVMKDKSMHEPQRNVWSMAEAKAHFGDLVEKAKTQGPQTITRHGKPTAVLVSAEEWMLCSQRKDSLAEFLSRSPQAGSGLQVRRLGFLFGQFSVPDDFDQMGSVEIEEMFDWRG